MSHFLTNVYLLIPLLVAAGCQGGGGMNLAMVHQKPVGAQKYRALFDDIVSERETDYRDIPASYAVVWSAAVDVAKSLGNPILPVDERNGIITLSSLEHREILGRRWRDSYSFNVSLSQVDSGPTRVSVKRILEEEDTLERVRYGGGAVGRSPIGQQWNRKQTNGLWESYLLTAIQERVAAMQVPAAIPQSAVPQSGRGISSTGRNRVFLKRPQSGIPWSQAR